MRALQKLTRNGSSTTVTIPRAVLIHLGWLTGEMIVLEVLEDQSVRVRRPTEADFAPKRTPRLVLDDTLPVQG